MSTHDATSDTAKVQLYVYDLSKGLAKSMSLMLTGKQIDGIWHTSVVAFGREIFFGQGIMEAKPGTTHHGAPMQIIDCGNTEIDPDTFQEYLGSLHELYTPSAYHLIEFNCNHFTADVVGFLTGATIPSWISGLPAEFLSTPFGQAMRPQIDAMFRGTSNTEHPVAGAAGPSIPTPPASGTATPSNLASALLSAVAQQATTAGLPTPTQTPPKSSPETSPLTLVTSLSNFTSILNNYPAVIVNFTNTAGCAPCRAIKPVYEAISETCAATFGPKGARFVEVELGVGDGQRIAGQYGARATPTFMFFKSGKKVDEMKGADKRGLEARVESFLDECFPQHPHRRLYLAVTDRLSTQPITATATPAFPALLSKLEGFANHKKQDVAVLKTMIVPFLENRANLSDEGLRALVDQWTAATISLLSELQPEQTFPLIDLWRIGLLNPRVMSVIALRLSSASSAPEPLGKILALTAATLKERHTTTPRPLLITSLRLSTNLLSSLPIANLILSSPSVGNLATFQTDVMVIIVDSLLHPEVSVRKAAADVAVNIATWRHRVGKERARAEGLQGEDEMGIEAEWEVEVLSALLEGIEKEDDEDVGHRLIVATAQLIYLSPGYEATIKPLLEVLDARGTLERASKRWPKKELRKLVDEVAVKLC